jgi:peptide/nickel transport system ATP-binding protein
VCRTAVPELYDVDDDDTHQNACYRSLEDHEYWESESLVDSGPDAESSGSTETAESD